MQRLWIGHAIQSVLNTPSCLGAWLEGWRNAIIQLHANVPKPGATLVLCYTDMNARLAGSEGGERRVCARAGHGRTIRRLQGRNWLHC